MNNISQYNSGVITLLRICTFLLAIVSFWATAQGMANYTFEQQWQAYAASLGIQGLLLGLNFSLPSFLQKCTTAWSKTALILLTCVVLACSSWFSYLFISGQAYGQSWDTESQLLAQDTYRSELFASDTYLEQYEEEMELTLADQITSLYTQATAMDTNKVNVAESMSWVAERSQYVREDSAARDMMSSVIDAMEQATMPNASQDVRQQSADIVSSMQTTLESTINSLDIRIETANARVEQATANLANTQARLRNAPANVDMTPYERAVDTAAKAYERSIENQSALEQQRQDYQSALQRTVFYSSILGMSEEGVSSYFVGANLRAIQRELFGNDPDSDRMMELATDIFDRLQSALELESNGTEDNQYQSFLLNMSQFVRYLENYRTIKNLGVDVQGLINQLSTGVILPLGDNSTQWKSNWREQFNDLKAKISGLPVYTLENNKSLLTSFDRSDSARRLDNATRYYLTDHNPAQQGLIYLYSPYRGIAIFSLIIALLLDIAAFITGFIIDREETVRQEDTSDEEGIHEYPAKNPSGAGQSLSPPSTQSLEQSLEWNAIPPLNRYIFFTGDYQYLNGVMTYKAIECGKIIETEYAGPKLQSGFYCWDGNTPLPLHLAELCYKGTSDNPKDGIYQDASIRYEDQLLILTQGEKGQHLGTVDPYTPVYRLSQDRYESFIAKDLKNAHGEMVIIALNHVGTRIVAIYIVESTDFVQED